MRVLKSLVFTLFTVVLACPAIALTEAVFLHKVMDSDSKAIIERKNGEQFIIEYGVGVLSIWRYVGKAVIISSPGIFLGVGSEIILPDENQRARIWNSKEVTNSMPTTNQGPLETMEDEVSLFDSSGKPTAYIDVKDEMTIYLWGGKPVAYIDLDSGDGSIYGFNGKHLGWFEKGIVRNHKGKVVGFVKGSVSSVITQIESIKSIKSLKSLKSLKDLKPLKPLFSQSFSEIPLKVFLGLGSTDDIQDILNE